MGHDLDIGRTEAI